MLTKAAVFLGAGFSHIAGLPLTGQLMNTQGFASSAKQLRHITQVIDTWRAWLFTHPGGSPDEFFQEVYAGQLLLPGVPWPYVVETLATILSQPVGTANWAGYNVRYANRLTRPLDCMEHIAFWSALLSSANLKGVITTNYDLLVERGLRHRPTKRPRRPGFFYGGLPFPQTLMGNAQPFSVQEQLRTVTLFPNGVPLCKLHGSLNWASQTDSLMLFQDCRPAFKTLTNVMIVPPLHEKSIPSWLQPVWSCANMVLTSVETLVVCGYSFPHYDEAILNLVAEAININKRLDSVHVIDPNGHQVATVLKARIGFAGKVEVYLSLNAYIELLAN